MADRIVRIATVGLGVGKGHVRRLAADPRAEVVAVCDSLPGRVKAVADEHGIEHRYADYDEMLRDKSLKLDAVTLALPNYLHEPFTVKALKRGLHVLCEKPMAHELKSARRMLDTSVRTGKTLMIRFNYRFSPQARYLKQMIDQGVVGKVYYGRTGWLRRKGIPMGTGWFSDKKLSGGGPLIDLAVHRIDLAWYLMGKPEPVAVSALTFDHLMRRLRREKKPRKGLFTVEDLAVGLIRFGDGSALAVEASWDTYAEDRERMWTHVFGDRGGLLHENVGGGYEFRAKVVTDSGEFPVDITPASYPGNLENEIDHFVRSILEGFEPEGSAKDGFAVQRMLDGMYRSAAQGREVKV
ncbi:MAG: Gfo/Idh/MocA family oxidoreductase [Planctomycetes bacterium]|nr:Gfo/Idh/MocA family oxidoreductase [Planctomycetota bacterium]